MTKRESKSQLTWTDVKAQLATFDRTALLGLLHHLYAAHKDNQAFLHARFGLGEDVLETYKKTIDRWLWPDPFRNQDTSVSKAKQAISHYKKAVGDPVGLTELMVFLLRASGGILSGYRLSRGRIFRRPGTHVRASPQVGQHATRERPR